MYSPHTRAYQQNSHLIQYIGHNVHSLAKIQPVFTWTRHQTGQKDAFIIEKK